MAGRRALDVGASTGGFTDCLLQAGAAHVVAVDVAYGELDWKLRSDARVTVIERCNARALGPDRLPYAPDLIVIDVSFISLTKVLPAVLACAAERFDCLALIKPQFEVGRSAVGKGGVVRDAAAAARRAGRRGLGGAAARGIGARFCQLRAARAEGQSRDVRVAGRGPGAARSTSNGRRSRSSHESGPDGHRADPPPAVGDAAGDRRADRDRP